MPADAKQTGVWTRAKRNPTIGENEDASSLKPFSGPLQPGLTSIVVIAHNRFELTRRCIGSVLRHTAPEYELIVVDNGSRDGTGLYLISAAGKCPRMRVVRKNRNYGVFARSFGMALARGEYICWLDNDVEVGEGWLEPLLKTMEDPAVGGAGAEGVALTPDWQHRFHTKDWPPERANGQTVDILVGYCLLFRNLTRSIGYLDPRFHPFWNEEADYSFRIKMLGYKLLVIPTNVQHHAHGTGLNLLADRNGHINRMNQLLIEKWDAHKHLVFEAYRDQDGTNTRPPT